MYVTTAHTYSYHPNYNDAKGRIRSYTYTQMTQNTAGMKICAQISRKAPQHTARGSHSNTYNQQRRKSKNTRANSMSKYSCFEYKLNVAQCTFYVSYKYIYRWVLLYARKHIDILQFQCIYSLARGLFYFFNQHRINDAFIYTQPYI